MEVKLRSEMSHWPEMLRWYVNHPIAAFTEHASTATELKKATVHKDWTKMDKTHHYEVVPDNCNKNNSAKKLVQIDETNGNNVVVEENNSPQQNNG